ncbi:MAG: Tad domain-containing protein [Burkholderiaceae bacterium]|jgi:hypothetical protein|nr:Tad domain-containing protein [Burkholderiaceae bacterium]
MVAKHDFSVWQQRRRGQRHSGASLPRRLMGQTILWFVGLMATMLLVGVGVYSVGQVTSEKQKVVNATDAAAYSGALVQARALNFIAYGNRAEIANEVFLAQAVSFHSWLLYMKTTVETLDTLTDILYAIPFAQAIAAFIDEVLGMVADVLGEIEGVVDDSFGAAVADVEEYARVLNDTSSEILNGRALATAAQQAADTVLAQNLANQNGRQDTAPVAIKKAELGDLNAAVWNGAFAQYTKDKRIHNSDDGRKTAADILLASRDEFSTERVGPSGILAPIIGNFSLGSCPPVEIGSSRDGPTVLRDYERWEAQDTSEFYIRDAVTKCDSNSMPVGWGRATLADDEDGDRGEARTSPHYLAGLRAYNDDEAHREHGDWTGVKALYDLERDTANGRPVKLEFVFHYAAAKRAGQVKTNDQLGFFDKDNATPHLGNTKLKPNLQNNEVASIAAAKVHFARPRNGPDFTGRDLFRADPHQEVGSLYNPYWQVRLTTPAERAMELVYGVGNAGLSRFSPNARLP